MKTRMKLKELTIFNKYAKACAEILRQTYPEDYDAPQSKETILHLLKGKNRLFIAEESERVIAFVGVLRHVFPYAYQIEPLIVKEPFRGQGVGGRLLELIEFKLKDEGVRTLFITGPDTTGETSLYNKDLFDGEGIVHHLSTVDYGHEALSFYTKRGYQVSGVIPEANGAGKPEIMLAKRISQK